MEYNSEDELIEDIATSYLDAEEPDGIEELYSLLGDYNTERVEDVPVPVEYVDHDPYDDAEDMFESIEREQKLEIFNGGSTPKYMSREENMAGRAVHDWFGHYQHQVDFSMEGEVNKYAEQRDDVPERCQSLLFAEVVGQVALVHYLEDGFDDERYEQRPVLLSEEQERAALDFYGIGA